MKTMWKRFGTVLFAGALICGMGCDEKKAEKPEATSVEAKGDESGEKKADGDKIEVTAAGAKIDPPVAKSKIPAGAYYCDMGTVHYARMDKGDGKCPLCGMMLTQMSADAGAAADKPGGAVVAGDEAAKEGGCNHPDGEACNCGHGEKEGAHDHKHDHAGHDHKH